MTKNKYFNIQKKDISAALTIFLIALPLSVGIAIASGAPASSGLLAAIVGGLLGSLLGNSQLTISGPAAGLIVVILGAVQEISAQFPNENAFKITLSAIVLAGVYQILFGAFGLGKLALAFPGAVIHGMLSAIGVIIISKQIPMALGVFPKEKEIIELITHIPHYITHANIGIVGIGTTTLFILLTYPIIKHPKTKLIPATLLAIICGTLFGLYIDIEHPHLLHFLTLHSEVGPNYLLQIPNKITQSIIFPNFNHISNILVIKWSLMIACIASLESVLSAYAIDKLDQQKRVTNYDRDLWSKGICNIFLGLIGGIPIISEIVRSSANISQGAQTRWSNFFHGLFILVFVLLFPSLLKMIPLGSLAVVLIMVGIRLAHPKHLIHAYHQGRDHFLSFVITLFMTLFTDLLIGVASGVIFEIITSLLKGVNLKEILKINLNEQSDNGQITLRPTGGLTFLHIPQFKKSIDKHNQINSLIVDLSQAKFVDYSFKNHLNSLRDELESINIPVHIEHKEIVVNRSFTKAGIK